MLRVVCDTNVLVSAFIAAGPPSRIIEEVIAGHVELVLPEPVTRELERVVTRSDQRHLLAVREHDGIRIVTPQALLAELRA